MGADDNSIFMMKYQFVQMTIHFFLMRNQSVLMKIQFVLMKILFALMKIRFVLMTVVGDKVVTVPWVLVDSHGHSQTHGNQFCQ